MKRRNIRLVHTLRDFYLLCKNSAFFRAGKTCVGRCAECHIVTTPRKWATSRVDTVVSISEYVLRTHRQYGYFDQVPSSVIYNIAGFDSRPNDLDVKPPNERLVFGYLGRVEQEKGIEVLLEALRRLSLDNWRLRIGGIGDEAYLADLKRRFVDPRIEWLGFVNAQKFYQSIDVMTIPSIWPEPLGRIVIEAFAAGKSAICARSGGIPEIAMFGKQVETYPPTDVGALASIMNRALMETSRWRKGGYRAESSHAVFSEEHVVGQYRAIYSSGPARTSQAHESLQSSLSAKKSSSYS